MPTRPKLRRVRKVWHDGLRSLPGLDGRRKRKEAYPIEDIPVGRNTVFDVTPDNEAELARVLGDAALARRLRALQRDKYPYGTMPELVIYDFLQRKQENFVYQMQLFGGYRAGGLVPDFAIKKAQGWLVWLIQGIYWHNIPGKREKDMADKLRLRGSYYHGEIIYEVVFLWENRIMTTNPARETVMEDGLGGIEHPA